MHYSNQIPERGQFALGAQQACPQQPIASRFAGGLGASIGGADLARPVTEIEGEMGRLRGAVDGAQSAFESLTKRLHSVRAEAPEVGETSVGESSPSTPLGGEIRELTYRIDALRSAIEYQLRTVALPG